MNSLLRRVKSKVDSLRAIKQSLLSSVPQLFPPGHFYSPVVDPIRMREREDKIWSERALPLAIDFSVQQQLRLLDDLKPHINTIDYPKSKPVTETTYFYDNDQFPVLDAEFLHLALMHFKPKRVIEVGSGFSSLITARVNSEYLEHSVEFVCVEPYPREFLKRGFSGLSNLVQSKVEDLDLSFFEILGENDILFIDSSHVSKTDSDVNYLFFEVLPRLKKGVFLHIHDIFLPDEYPKVWVEQGRGWNEQYLLHAFLQYNQAWKVVWASHFMGTRYRSDVQKVFPKYPKYGGGGSIWLQKLVD
jgi:hypothetical protein